MILTVSITSMEEKKAFALNCRIALEVRYYFVNPIFGPPREPLITTEPMIDAIGIG
jgi:hypothetical protein